MKLRDVFTDDVLAAIETAGNAAARILTTAAGWLVVFSICFGIDFR